MDKEKDFLKTQQSEINKRFKDAQKVYDQQAAQLQQLQPEYEQSIIQGYEVQKPILQQQATSAMENLGLQKETTKQTRESALTQARRQYEQGLQKTQQLFGGVAPSSAAVASSDILAGEQLRQMGQAQTQSAQNLMQIGTAERDVQAQLANSLQQLEVRKQQDLLKLRDAFRQELNQINQARGTLAQNKATAQLQALQDFNTRRRALDDMVTTQRMNLETYAKQLQLQAKYNTAAQVNIPDFSKMNSQAIADNILNLKRTKAGQDALTFAGWTPEKIAGKEIWQNQRTGYTLDLGGTRYADNSIQTWSDLDKDERTFSAFKDISTEEAKKLNLQ